MAIYNITDYTVTINGKSFKLEPQQFLADMAMNPRAKKVS